MIGWLHVTKIAFPSTSSYGRWFRRVVCDRAWSVDPMGYIVRQLISMINRIYCGTLTCPSQRLQQDGRAFLFACNSTKSFGQGVLLISTMTIKYFTVDQQIGLFVAAIFSSTISLLGSSLILRYICRNYKAVRRAGHSGRRRGGAQAGSNSSPTYLRIMFAMSCFDIIYSINLIMQPLLVDVSTTTGFPKYDFPIGNMASCTAVGTFHQIRFGGFIYYGMLSFYYLLTVRMGKSQEWMAKRAEPVMHTIAIGFPLITSLTGVILDAYSYLDLYLGCWVANYPKTCQFPDSELDCSAIPGYIFGGIPFFVFIPSLIINNILVYCHVRKIYRTQIPSRSTSSPGSGTLSTAQLMAAARSQESFALSNSSLQQSREFGTLQQSREFGAADSANVSSLTITGTMDGGLAQTKRLQQVATQATLYVAAAFLTYLPLIFSELVLTTILEFYLEWQYRLFRK